MKPILMLAVALGAGALAASPAYAQGSAAVRACEAGTDPKAAGSDYGGGLSKVGGGLTPQALEGATTVSVAEAVCLRKALGNRLVVLAAMNDADRLPDAHKVAWAAGGTSLTDDTQARFAATLKELTGGDKSRPLLVYCHHERCFLSYNVAMRAVADGFKSVYWMREGIAGWKLAKLALAPQPVAPAQPVVPARLVAPRPGWFDNEVKDCGRYTTDVNGATRGLNVIQFESPAEANVAWADQIAQAKKSRRDCLDYLRRQIVAENATGTLPEIDALIARSDAAVGAAYARAHDEFAANTHKTFVDWSKDRGPSDLRHMLSTAAEVQTVQQACGSFAFVTPSMDNSVLQAVNSRFHAYGKCITDYRESDPMILKDIYFESAVKLVGAMKPYTCAVRRVANCVDDDAWQALRDVATHDNLALVKRAAAVHGKWRSFIEDEIDRLNDYMTNLNETIRRHNAR